VATGLKRFEIRVPKQPLREEIEKSGCEIPFLTESEVPLVAHDAEMITIPNAERCIGVCDATSYLTCEWPNPVGLALKYFVNGDAARKRGHTSKAAKERDE
jgi:hypothetical protein